jgi:hypothetical protein
VSGLDTGKSHAGEPGALGGVRLVLALGDQERGNLSGQVPGSVDGWVGGGGARGNLVLASLTVSQRAKDLGIYYLLLINWMSTNCR